MISVILTTSGTYNVIGIDDDMFVLQGNLSKDQLKELKKEIDKALKAR